jgi:micrococcal nuclease
VAKQKLSALIFNKNVVATQMDIDRYKRTVAIVYNNENKCVNEEMLKSGLAWHYVKYDNNANWQQLETNARQNKIGLWADNNPVAPWQWRANMRHH